MHVLPYANLEDVRHAIRNRCLVSFVYKGDRITAEPYLLGNFQKTHALILVAWKMTPEEGWEHYRYSQMRDFEVQREHFYHSRTGFTPHDRKIVGIDTMVSGYAR